MINDVVIIKDGLPLLSKNFANPNNTFSQNDNLIMISGFFSALESFSSNFEGLGAISELKLANNGMKLSFLRDLNFPNLIYLANYDENSKSVNVQRFLRKVSNNFLKLYNAEQILNWRGRKDAFKGFERFLSQYVEEEAEEIENNFKEKVLDLFDGVKEKIDEGHESSLVNKKSDTITEKTDSKKVPDYYDYVPISRMSKVTNLNYYLTGDLQFRLFHQMDGAKSIKQIAEELNLPPEKIFNCCKNLIKLGFISLVLKR